MKPQSLQELLRFEVVRRGAGPVQRAVQGNAPRFRRGWLDVREPLKFVVDSFDSQGVRQHEVLPQVTLESILVPVARAQEPKASPLRLRELVDRIVSRALNFPCVYANTRTGEVETG